MDAPQNYSSTINIRKEEYQNKSKSVSPQSTHANECFFFLLFASFFNIQGHPFARSNAFTASGARLGGEAQFIDAQSHVRFLVFSFTETNSVFSLCKPHTHSTTSTFCFVLKSVHHLCISISFVLFLRAIHLFCVLLSSVFLCFLNSVPDTSSCAIRLGGFFPFFVCVFFKNRPSLPITHMVDCIFLCFFFLCFLLLVCLHVFLFLFLF